MPDPSRFAQRLAASRERWGWSQAELARRAGLSQKCVSMIEAGDRIDPRASTLEALAGALGVTMDSLWRGAWD